MDKNKRVLEVFILSSIAYLFLLFFHELIKLIIQFNLAKYNQSYVKVIVYLLFLILLSVIQFKLKRKEDYKSVQGIIEDYLNIHKIIMFLSLLLVTLILVPVNILIMDEVFIYSPPNDTDVYNMISNNDLFEEQYIKNGVIEYRGFSKISEENSKTIIFFGGTGQSSALIFDYYNTYGWRYLEEYNFIMIDYPGYGTSLGSPNQERIYEMALSTFDYILDKYNLDNDDITVMSHSLGTGVASYLASERDFSKLVLIAPYTSMIDVMNSQLNVIYGPLNCFVNNAYRSIELAPLINEDVLIIASKADTEIDYRLSIELSENIENMSFFLLNDISHGSLLFDEQTEERISDFLQTN